MSEAEKTREMLRACQEGRPLIPLMVRFGWLGEEWLAGAYFAEYSRDVLDIGSFKYATPIRRMFITDPRSEYWTNPPELCVQKGHAGSKALRLNRKQTHRGCYFDGTWILESQDFFGLVCDALKLLPTWYEFSSESRVEDEDEEDQNE